MFSKHVFCVSAMTPHKRVCGGYDGSSDEEETKKMKMKRRKMKLIMLKLTSFDNEEAFEVIYL